MRWLVAILLLAPLAAAQTNLPPAALTLEADQREGVAQPLGDPVEIPLTVRVSCDPSIAAGKITILYELTRFPPWGRFTLTPSEDEAHVSACRDGVVTFETRLVALATSDAPAFAPEELEVTATAHVPLREPARATLALPFTAGYFSIIDVNAERSQISVAPGSFATFRLRVTNFGNAATRLSFEVDAERGLRVQIPPPIVLGSRQAGSNDIAQDALLVAHRVDEGTRLQALQVRWHAAYALDARLAGEGGQMSLLVLPGRADTIAAAPPQELIEARVPGAGAALAAAGAIAAALARRR